MRLRHLLTTTSVLIMTGVVSLSLHGGEADAVMGKNVFARRCSGCHSPDINKGGPRLRGILKRKAASVDGFPYSEALKKSGIVWDEKQLDRWIEKPEAVVKDNDMEFGLANAEERAAIIAYLKTLSQ